MLWPRKIIHWGFHALFFLTPLVWFAKTSELFEFNKMILVWGLTTIILGAWAAEMILQKKVIFLRTVLDFPLLIFLGVSILSLVFSIDVHTSWWGYYSRWNGGVLSLLSYALLYWAYVTFMDAKSTIINLQFTIFSVVVVSLYAALEHFGVSLSCLFTTGKLDVACWVQDVQNRVFATMGQPNWLASYIVALIFLPLSHLTLSSLSLIKERESRSRVRYLTSLGIFLLLFITLLFTKSRSGLLAFGISSVIFWLYAFWKLKFRNYLVIGIWCLIIGMGILIIPNPIRDLIIKSKSTPDLPLSSSPALETGGTESGTIRKIVWTGAIRAWLGTPKQFWLGSGPETFAQIYYRYRPIEHNQTSEWELLYNKAHNEFLNQLTTTGVLGLLSYVVLLLAMLANFKFLIFNLKSILNSLKISNFKLKIEEKSENMYLGLALFCGWLTISITNFWGFSVVMTQVLLFLLPAMAATLHLSPSRPPLLKSGEGLGVRWLMVVLAVFVIGYLLYEIGTYWAGDYHYAAGQNYFRSFAATQKADYLAAAYDRYLQAYKLNSQEPFILSDFSLTTSYLALVTKKGDFIGLTDSLSQQAILISPRHPNFYKTRAKAMIVLSELDAKYLPEASSALQQANKLSPTDPRILFNLGAIAEYQFATPSALQYYQKALDLKPDFADAKAKIL